MPANLSSQVSGTQSVDALVTFYIVTKLQTATVELSGFVVCLCFVGPESINYISDKSLLRFNLEIPSRMILFVDVDYVITL
jgi:hypothetical protein